jgi:hypothetical protein
LNHPRLCTLADPANPDATQRDAYIALLRGDPKPVPAPPPAPKPGPAPPPPTFTAKIITATAAAVNFVASGFAVLPEDQVNARLAVCSTCDQRTAGGMCSGCGCLLAAKARLPAESCPMDKWAKS